VRCFLRVVLLQARGLRLGMVRFAFGFIAIGNLHVGMYMDVLYLVDGRL
jgi:hypothetical protein